MDTRAKCSWHKTVPRHLSEMRVDDQKPDYTHIQSHDRVLEKNIYEQLSKADTTPIANILRVVLPSHTDACHHNIQQVPRFG